MADIGLFYIFTEPEVQISNVPTESELEKAAENVMKLMSTKALTMANNATLNQMIETITDSAEIIQN